MAGNILKAELIGMDVRVFYSSNPLNNGIKGKIIDETKNSFLIKTKNTHKRVIKEQCVFEFTYKGKTYRVNGKLLTKRPHERIKHIRCKI